MFRSVMCGCLAVMLAGPAALGENKNDPQVAQWAGTYQNAQVTLELKAKADATYEGTILFNGQNFPLTARGGADQLSGMFRSGNGSFRFMVTRDGDTVNLVTAGKTYPLKQQAANPLGEESPANPLGAAASAPPQNAASSASGGAPEGYRAVTTTDFGKKLVAHKADAKSVPAALTSTLQDLSKFFDAKPAAQGAFADAKEHRRGGAPFTAKLKGQPVKGLIFCVVGEKGADVTVTYCRADAPTSEWAKLSSSADAAGGAGTANTNLETYAFPDGTGRIQFPAGWKCGAQTCINGVRVEGPAGQLAAIFQRYTICTPDSWFVQTHNQVSPQTPLDMLVAPYTGPVDALKNLVPQISLMSQRKGGPAVTLDKILEPPKPAKAAFSQGQAAEIYYALTYTKGGIPTRYRASALIETWGFDRTLGSWSVWMTELSGPDASFEKDYPVMLAIVKSLYEDPQACQQATGRAVDAMNAKFRAGQQAHAAQQAAFEAGQQARAGQQEAFDNYLKSTQGNSLSRDRSITDFDEMIRGERTVQDTRTGERTSVDLGNVDKIVDRLNEHDPGRYEQIPLRDELYPLPQQRNP